MKKETALKRINNAVKQRLPNESEQVRNYIAEIIFLTYDALRMDAYEDDTDTSKLKFAIEVNLFDELTDLVEEAKRETI